MTFKNKLFKRFALVLFSVFVVNTLASIFFWYQSIRWFDNVTHFLGGVAGGLFLAWLLYKKYHLWRQDGKIVKIIIVSSLLFLLVAGLWEVMEFSVQDLFKIGNILADKLDSIADMSSGLVGSWVALLYYFLKSKKEDV